MASWVGAWLRGEDDDGNENNENAGTSVNAEASAAVTPSADEMRQKRMARLERLEQEAKAKAEADAREKEKEEAIMQVHNSNEMKDTNTEKKEVATPPKAPQVQIAPPAAPVVSTDRKQQKSPKKSLIHLVLQRIFKFTLDPTEDGGGNGYFYLQKYAEEQEDAQARDITLDNMSELLFARLSCISTASGSETTVMNYLMHCFCHCREEQERLELVKSSKKTNQSDMVERMLTSGIPSIEEICINYSVIALTESDMFPAPAIGHVGILIQEVRKMNAVVNSMYLHQLVSHLDAAQCATVFRPIFQQLIQEVMQLAHPDSILSDFFSNLSLLNALCRFKPVAQVLTEMPGFLLLPGAPITGLRVEQATAFGILLRFSTESKDPGIQHMYQHLTKKTRNEVVGHTTALRGRLNMLHDGVEELVTSCLKAGSGPRSRVLHWFREACVANVERTKENPNPAVASNAAMVSNISAILLRLCRPFLNPESAKAKLIQSSMYIHGREFKSVLRSDETMLVTNIESQSNNSPSQGEVNFITECFFITARSLTLGPVSVIRTYRRMLQQLSHVQSQMRDMTTQTPGHPNLERMKMHFEMLLSRKMTLDAYLLNPAFLHAMIEFCILSSTVLVQLFGAKTLSCEMTLPLPSPPPIECAHIPEHFVEDIGNVLAFVAKIVSGEYSQEEDNRQIWTGCSLEHILTFIVVILSSPEYVRSPHLRAKMSRILFDVFLPEHEKSSSSTTIHAHHNIERLLSNHRLSERYLAPCLLALYGDVEQTGFYDKLEHRYNIACILKYLWKLPKHKLAFVQISQDLESFVRFANGLMNHINGLVTDALTSLPEIKLLTEEMNTPGIWNLLDAPTQDQKRSLLAEKERTVTSSLQLANETIHMLSYLTSEIQEPFLVPELVDRLASMLNNVLLKLLGPRGVELKVTNPEQYHFRPRVMLREIMATYVHFANFSEFHLVVAKNGLYDHNVMKKGLAVAKRIQLFEQDVSQVAKFETLVDTIQNVYECELQQASDLGDIPEEFLDPLMCTLMEDPVTLPSGYIVDRKTIAQHLLNDATDPFTRAPLTAEQIVPHDELRGQIQTWLASKNVSSS